MNLAFTVFSLGLWSVVWLDRALYEAKRPYKCKYCGNTRDLEYAKRSIFSSKLLWTLAAVGIIGGTSFWVMN